jgi:phosphocarrier protein
MSAHGSPAAQSPARQATVIVRHPIGLHARPSVRFTRLAKAHAAEIVISLDEAGPWVNAKSIVRVMGLKAPQGARLHLRAQGGDADEALIALVRYLEGGRDEGAGHAVAV